MKTCTITLLVLVITAVSTVPPRAIAQGSQLPLIATYRPSDQLGGFVTDVAISGDYAYVSVMNEHDWFTTLRVVSVANKAAPVEMGVYRPYNHISDLAVAANYVYVVFGFQGQGSGLQIIDISNPKMPTLVGSFTLSEDLWSVTIAYPYAYVGSSSALRIIDVSDPTRPLLLTTYATAYPVQDIAIGGSYAYIAGGETGGLRIINVADPNNPIELGFRDTPGGAVGVVVYNQYAYIADTQQGLLVIDTSAPTTPTEIGNYATSWALGVAVSGNYVYVTDYYDGLHVVSVTDLANPVRVAYYTTRANQIAISGFYIYISTVVGGNGMPILSFAPPQHIYLPVILKSH